MKNRRYQWYLPKSHKAIPKFTFKGWSDKDAIIDLGEYEPLLFCHGLALTNPLDGEGIDLFVGWHLEKIALYFNSIKSDLTIIRNSAKRFEYTIDDLTHFIKMFLCYYDMGGFLVRWN